MWYHRQVIKIKLGVGVLGNKLSGKQYTLIASMLFGMFFGAGNLIFPIILGAKSGSSLIPALIGMLITAVGIPLLGVVAMGVSRSEGLMEMSGRVSKGYSYFFTCALYLTIGPFFAIPRCAATSFTMGISPMVDSNVSLYQWIFTTLFFVAVLYFSLKPSDIMNSIGKWLNPIFLILLGILTVTALIYPVQKFTDVVPVGDYASNAFSAGFLQGYDTLDALASLAFGIIVINVIRGFGTKEPSAIAKSTVKSGIFSMAIMAIIYALIALVGAQSFGLYADRITDPSFNGGHAFAIIAEHYFGKIGLILIALIVTFCCLKTAIGLVTACSETFVEIFPKTFSYKVYAIIFSVFSLVVSNIGLSKIIAFSAPVLYFLYPLSIALILTSLFGRYFGHSRCVYVSAISFTMIAAILDLFRVGGIPGTTFIVEMAGKWIPLYNLGLGWIIPLAVGLIVGFAVKFITQKNRA